MRLVSFPTAVNYSEPTIASAARRRQHTFKRRVDQLTAEDRPGLEDILPTMLMPCCLYAGEIDPVYLKVKACSQHIPRVTFFSLPGLGHCEAYARSELVLPRVTGFFK